MNNPTDPITTIIENALTNGLIHPGNGDGPIALSLPMFDNNHIPGEMAEQFANNAALPHPNIAKLVAEALTHHINGHHMGHNATHNDAGNGHTKSSTTAYANAGTPNHPPITPTCQRLQPKHQTTRGSMHVIIDGETVMTDIADWKNNPPARLIDAMNHSTWFKPLMVAITDTATNTHPTSWTMTVAPNQIIVETNAGKESQHEPTRTRMASHPKP